MQQVLAATVLILVLFAGAFAALFSRRSWTEEARTSPSPRWQAALLGSVAAALALLVLTVYLYS